MPDPVVQSTDVEYTVEGTTMVGRLALPAADGLRPAVLIAHDGGGLDEYQKARAERFAELGYVAFAMDYYGHGRSVTDDDAAARCLALWSEPERIRESATAALDLLRTQPKLTPNASERSGTASVERSHSSWPGQEPTSRRSSASTRDWRLVGQRMQRTSAARCLCALGPTTRSYLSRSESPSRSRCERAVRTGSCIFTVA